MAKRFIDADALAERMRLQYCKDCDNYNGVRCGSCDIDFAFDMVEDAPTADVVEVRHAEWIWVEDGVDDYEQYWVCSVCKEKTYFETKFCSECGAKMDGNGGE